jgi:uncharacterized protein YegP (UPF0339 family)
VAKLEVYTSSNGEYRWRLKPGNCQAITTSGEGYTSKDSAINGIDAVKRAAAPHTETRPDPPRQPRTVSRPTDGHTAS